MFQRSLITTLKALLAAALVLGLSACATTQSGVRGAGMKATGTSLPVDADRIARVESVARRNGVQVYWVNPPRRNE
jgi:starvation-inducible outer membrane lipoprotein